MNGISLKLQSTSSDCTFCALFPSTFKIEHESFNDFYFKCPQSNWIARRYFLNLFNFQIDLITVVTRGSQEQFPLNIILNIEALLFCFFLHSCKISKKIPTFNNFMICAFEQKKLMIRTSNFYRQAYTTASTKYGLTICDYNRKWLDWVGI